MQRAELVLTSVVVVVGEAAPGVYQTLPAALGAIGVSLPFEVGVLREVIGRGGFAGVVAEGTREGIFGLPAARHGGDGLTGLADGALAVPRGGREARLSIYSRFR